MSSRSLAAFYVPKLKRSSNKTERQSRQSGLHGSEKETKETIRENFSNKIFEIFEKKRFLKIFVKTRK